jgi:hypothetical protein
MHVHKAGHDTCMYIRRCAWRLAGHVPQACWRRTCASGVLAAYMQLQVRKPWASAVGPQP